MLCDVSFLFKLKSYKYRFVRVVSAFFGKYLYTLNSLFVYVSVSNVYKCLYVKFMYNECYKLRI